jgi:hypothetical protein
LKQRRIELFFHKTQKVKPTMLKEWLRPLSQRCTDISHTLSHINT